MFYTYTGSRTTMPTAALSTMSAPPKKAPIPTRDKIPVPEPLPPVVVSAPPSSGVPMWAWIAGGVAVVGGVAFLATRKKAA